MRKFLSRMRRIEALTNEKQRNAGLSLVEILVVFAILAILVGIGISSWTILKSADTSKSSSNIASCYEELKSTTMSKTGDWRMEITRADNDMYYAAIYNGTSLEGEMLELGKYVDIYFKDEKDGSAGKITKASPLIIKLKASTGGVSEITYGGAVKYSSSAGYTSTYGSIEMHLNGAKRNEIKLYYITGKAVKD